MNEVKIRQINRIEGLGFKLLNEYKNKKTPVRLECNNCGKIFSIRPDGLFRFGIGCNCKARDPKNKVTHDVLSKKLRKIGRELVSISEDRATVTLICVCGKKYSIKFSTLLSYVSSKRTFSCGCIQQKYFNSIKNERIVGEVSKRFFNQYKAQAKRRSLSFNITAEDIWNLYIKQNKRCVLTGNVLVFSERTQTLSDTSVSIDRIKTNIGYEKNNIRIIDKKVNLIKWEYSDEEFLKLCKTILGKISNKKITKEKPTNWLSVVCHIRSSAKKRKIHYEIDEQFIFDLLNKQGWCCAISGKRLNTGSGSNCVGKNCSLDRIDNKIGYVKNNVWWIDSHINKIKRTLTVEELKNICIKVLEYEKDNKDKQSK